MSREVDSGTAAVVIVVFLILAVAFFWSATRVDVERPKTVTVDGRFPTLMDCVTTIQQKAGPLEIVIDKPDTVTGRTAAGKHFGCSRQVTGTQGTCYYGWFDAPDR